MKNLVRPLFSLLVLGLSACGSGDDETAAQFNACTNKRDVLNLPFSYILTESDRILTPGYVDSDQHTYVHFAPFGSHFSPMSDVPYGSNRVNFVGFFSESDLDVTPQGYDGLAGASRLHERRPMYYAPASVKITSINYVEPDTLGVYLDSEPNWELTLDFGDKQMVISHAGKMSPALNEFLARDPSLGDGGINIDTHTYNGPTGNIFPAGYYVTATAGVELAYPQVFATETGTPGYYDGTGSQYPDRPNVQIEFVVTARTSQGQAEVCTLKLLSTSLQNTFQGILDNDLTNPDSQFYGTYQDNNWQWRAESDACVSCSSATNDLNGLYKDLGGWFEKGDNANIKNELVAFVPVDQDNPSYDSTLYRHDVQTEWLILRRRNDSQSFDWQMNDLSIESTDEPAGEIISVEADAILVNWRDLGQSLGNDAYQWIRYDVTDGVVTLKFGDFHDDFNSVVKPNFDIAVDVPNDDDILTFTKSIIAGF